MLTEELLVDPGLSANAKLVIGAHAAHPLRQPNRKELLQAMPFLNYEKIAAAHTQIAQKRYAFIDRTRNKHGKPIRLQKLVALADTRRPDTKIVHIPTAPLGALSRRTGATDTLLFGLYHAEQRQRHGVQIADRTAAAILGCAETTIRASRTRLIDAGLLVLVAERPQYSPSIYSIPSALPQAEARFDPGCDDPYCQECFKEERTRGLRTILIGDTPVTLLTSEAELARAEVQIEKADEATLDRIAQLAESHAAFIPAQQLLAVLPDNGPWIELGLPDSNHSPAAAPDDEAPLNDADIPF